MKTFAERLLIAIKKRGLSQTKAARQIGITQQAMNYIITKNLESSKLAPKIACALAINPEWLIYNRGKFEETKIFELPLIHSVYMLKKYLNNDLDFDDLTYTVIDIYLGERAFAYLVEPKKIAICYSAELSGVFPKQFLIVNDNSISISGKKENLSFSIFEWRTRDVNY